MLLIIAKTVELLYLYEQKSNSTQSECAMVLARPYGWSTTIVKAVSVIVLKYAAAV